LGFTAGTIPEASGAMVPPPSGLIVKQVSSRIPAYEAVCYNPLEILAGFGIILIQCGGAGCRTFI